jgi:hypothetical protein
MPALPVSAAAPQHPTRRLCLAAASAAGLALGLAHRPAWALAMPTGKVLLSVTGRVTSGNAPQRADFDLAMLDALAQHSFATSTPWYKEARKFSGPLLRDVLAAAGANGSTLGAIALNNYKVEIPADDAQKFKVLLATRMDDKTMAVRDKGPLFIIYPYDDSADLRNERYYSRSAWQLRKIDVK